VTYQKCQEALKDLLKAAHSIFEGQIVINQSELLRLAPYLRNLRGQMGKSVHMMLHIID
jgi:hypothetical protein